jgi:hypothetical protein
LSDGKLNLLKKPGEYRQINFTVLDTEGRKKEKQIGGLKYYGKKLPKDLDKEIGNAVIQAQWYQASND